MPNNIYLDIDGVILANEYHAANYAQDFLVFLTDNYPVFWLTTQCQGNNIPTLAYLARVLPPIALNAAKKVKPTTWKVNKTEAIDFSQPFTWYDDFILEGELLDLRTHNSLKNWIKIDLSKDPYQLIKLVNFH